MKYIIGTSTKKPNIDDNVIIQIEDKLKNNYPITDDETEILLDYIVYSTRMRISDNIDDDTLEHKDLLAASIIANYLKELGVDYKVCNTKYIFNKNVVENNFIVANINTDLYGNSIILTYLIDPTYRQFFLTNKCSKDKLYIEHHVIQKTPDPGYFIHPEDAYEIAYFLLNGYAFLDLEFANIYANSFMGTRTHIKEKESDFLTVNEAYDDIINGCKHFLMSKLELEEKGLLLEPKKQLVKKM